MISLPSNGNGDSDNGDLYDIASLISLRSTLINIDGRVDFDPDTSRAMRFAFGPTDGNGEPFDISPVSSFDSLGVVLMCWQDDPSGSFGGSGSRLLGTVPGHGSSGSDLSSGSPKSVSHSTPSDLLISRLVSPSFANIGMGVLGTPAFISPACLSD